MPLIFFVNSRIREIQTKHCTGGFGTQAGQGQETQSRRQAKIETDLE